MKKTVVIGVSTNPDRYAYKAVHSLVNHGHETIAVGIREGEVANIVIQTDKPKVEGVDTVTLYVGPKNQPVWYDYILELNPKRLVLNPGTHNPELINLVKSNGIKVEEACTLVMLSIGNY